MIKEVIGYTVLCDRCGKDALASPHSDFCSYSEAEFAIDQALCMDWERIEGSAGAEDKIVCPDCWMWSEDGEEIITKPPVEV